MQPSSLSLPSSRIYRVPSSTRLPDKLQFFLCWILFFFFAFLHSRYTMRIFSLPLLAILTIHSNEKKWQRFVCVIEITPNKHLVYSFVVSSVLVSGAFQLQLGSLLFYSYCINGMRVSGDAASAPVPPLLPEGLHVRPRRRKERKNPFHERIRRKPNK